MGHLSSYRAQPYLRSAEVTQMLPSALTKTGRKVRFGERKYGEMPDSSALVTAPFYLMLCELTVTNVPPCMDELGTGRRNPSSAFNPSFCPQKCYLSSLFLDTGQTMLTLPNFLPRLNS